MITFNFEEGCYQENYENNSITANTIDEGEENLETEEVTSVACPDCGERITREDVMDLFERCETLVRRLDKDTDYMVWMSLGKKLAKMLPTNNFLLVQVKKVWINKTNLIKYAFIFSSKKSI